MTLRLEDHTDTNTHDIEALLEAQVAEGLNISQSRVTVTAETEDRPGLVTSVTNFIVTILDILVQAGAGTESGGKTVEELSKGLEKDEDLTRESINSAGRRESAWLQRVLTRRLHLPANVDPPTSSCMCLLYCATQFRLPLYLPMR